MYIYLSKFLGPGVYYVISLSAGLEWIELCRRRRRLYTARTLVHKKENNTLQAINWYRLLSIAAFTSLSTWKDSNDLIKDKPLL